jgi:uncharacterized protein YhaN
MRITRLRLQDVKRHADLDLELSPGLTIIRGANEAGKTTIQRAIEIVLFRRATSTAQELDGVRRWGAQADPRVTLEFEDEGIRGTLTKIFAGQRGTVELETAEGVERDPAAVEHVIASLTGLPSERFFLATASIRHHDLADLKQDEGTLRDRLQQSMSGATRGTHAAKRKLDEQIRRYRSEGPKNPGQLKLARSEVERLEAKVLEGEGMLRQLDAQRVALAAARSQREALDEEMARQQAALEQAERAVKLLRRGEEAQRRYAAYKRAAELHSEIGRLEASHPSNISLPGLRAAVERLRQLEYRLSEIRAERAAEPDLSSYDVNLPAPRWERWAIASAGLAVGALLVGAAAVAIAGMLLPALVGAVVLAALAAVTAVMAVRRRRQLSDVRLQNELRDSEIARRLRGRTELVDELARVERDRDEALATLSLPDLAAADSLLAAESDHVAQIERAKAEYRGLLGDTPAGDDVAELRDKAAAEVDECRHALAGMGDIGAEPEKSLATYRAQVERLRYEREQALAAEMQADARLEANKVDAEQVAADVEALELANETLRQVERRLRVYEYTLEALTSAEKQTMQKAARFLEQRMAADIERITDGRYRRLEVDEAELKFRVFSVESNEWVDAGVLSQGTLDQLYLCARLGIVRQVTQPASPPLIFDDPFVTFDEDRARRAVEVLREYASELQVIYLTCSDRYDDIADKVIVLPTPDARDAAEAVEAEAVAPVAAAAAA